MTDNKITIGGILIYTTFSWNITSNSIPIPESDYSTTKSICQEGLIYDTTDIFKNYLNRDDLKIERIAPNRNVLTTFIKTIVENSIPLDEKIAKFVDDNFWDLI